MEHGSYLWYRLSRSNWFFALSKALAFQSLGVLLSTLCRAIVILWAWANTLKYTIYMPTYLLIDVRASLDEGRGLHWVICQYIIHLTLHHFRIY